MKNEKVQRVVMWVKNNKLALALVAVVLFLLWRSNPPTLMSQRAPMYQAESEGFAMDSTSSFVGSSAKRVGSPLPPMSPPSSVDLYNTDRKVVRNSDISLYVKDVRSSLDQILKQATSVGGFMVSSSAQTPDQGGSGNIIIRVPSEKLDSTMQFLRDLSVKVVYESVTGFDVTDQYTDTEARLATLTKTKATFEGMMDKAVNVDEILRVQQSILQVQDQIDSLKGQLEYLKNTSQSSLITVSLSTDELALPYSPSDPWRPSVVFKTAVRSMVMNLRQVANVGIWGVVYLPVFIILFILILIIKRKLK